MLHVMTHLESSHAYYKNPVHTQTKSVYGIHLWNFCQQNHHTLILAKTLWSLHQLYISCVPILGDSRLWERLVFNFAKLEVCEANFIKSFCFIIFPEDVLKTKRPRFSNQKTYLKYDPEKRLHPEKGHQHRLLCRSSSSVSVIPFLQTIQATGVSPHFSSGLKNHRNRQRNLWFLCCWGWLRSNQHHKYDFEVP